MTNRLKILLIAEESAGIQTLKALADSPHEVVAVMASESKSREGSASVWSVAKRMDVPLWPAEEARTPELARRVRAAETDVVVNVHSLYVVHQEVLQAATMGAFNLHPGPLPECAGLNAPSWAIYQDRKEHAVTVHRMEAGIDTGSVVFEKKFAISEKDTGLSLALKCIKEGVPLVLKVLDCLARDPASLPSKEQDLDRRKYFGRKPPQQGKLDWTKRAREIHNFVRASDYAPFSSPWGYPAAHYNGQQILISKTALTDRRCYRQPGEIALDREGNIVVACADAWLVALRIVVDGKHYRATDHLKPDTAFKSRAPS